MTAFDINFTTEEAARIVAALGFIRHNLAVDATTLQWSFVGGQSISYDIAALVQLEDIIYRLNESIQEAFDTHPFNPYIRVY